MSSSDESTLAPSVGIIDASTSARAKPSKSDSLLVSFKSALRTAAAWTHRHEGLHRRFRLLPRLLLLLSYNFSYDETILLRQVAPVYHHFHVLPPRHQCLRSLPSCFVFKLDLIYPGLYRNIGYFRLLTTWKKSLEKKPRFTNHR